MDVRRAFPFLLLMICAAFAIRNNYGGHLNNIRRVRKISLSEYLVPPPPPKFYPGRNPRTAPLPTEEPGYFSHWWDWLNPFKYGSSSSSSSPSPAPYETPYTRPKFTQPPPPPTDYDKPPLPSSSFNNPVYSPPAKTKDCNPCNKVPWTPMQTDVSHSGDTSYAPSTHQVLPITADYPLPSNDNYPPLSNPQVPYDAHHAASQEVRAPDYTFVSTLSTDGQDLTGFSVDPRLYAEATPPLYNAQDFHSHQKVPSVFKEISDLEVSSPAENSSYLSTIDPELTRYPVYLGPFDFTNPKVINQELGYNNPSASNGELGQFGARDHSAHDNLFSSGTQVTHANPISDNQGFENIVTHPSSPDSQHQQTFGSPNVLQPSEGEADNGESYVTGPQGDFFDNSSQINQNLPSSYGISGPEVPNNPKNQYDDLSSSGNVAKDTYAPLRESTSAESSTKIEDSIHFEESPLLDFTHKGESRTKSSSIPPTSNAIAETAESVESTLAPGEEVFGTRQEVASTKTTYFQTTDPLTTITTPTTTTPTTTQAGFLTRIFNWSFWNTDVISANDTKKAASNQNANVNSDKQSVTQQSVKKNKQVQVIIPYTQQHTPLPFNARKVPQVVSNHDSYVAEGSSNAIKVTGLPDSSTSHTRPTFPVPWKNVTRKSASTNANNSIDVHKLQKNIDDWIMQEYSKSTTASTASPSSASPYLFPSKKIPREYLTTTESLDHIASSHENNNAKTFTLGGFIFNDIDYKASTSNRVEKKSQVQVAQNNSIDDASVVPAKDDSSWPDVFSVNISQMNKEPVYLVTSQPVVTTPESNPIEQRKEKAMKEAERNPKDSRQVSETETKKSTTNSNTFEKAYQVLPQAVNNLAVASTGPESTPLWSSMEHEKFASLDDDEEDETAKGGVQYNSGHSKVTHARR